MRANKSSGTKPELLTASHLRRARLIGWRRNVRGLPGSPDFAWPHERVALFVDGCFWHGCPLHRSTPKTNAEFWRRKFDRNRRRDWMVDRVLAKLGWSVVRSWECTVRHNPQKLVDALRRELRRRPAQPHRATHVKPTDYKRRRTRRRSDLK